MLTNKMDELTVVALFLALFPSFSLSDSDCSPDFMVSSNHASNDEKFELKDVILNAHLIGNNFK